MIAKFRSRVIPQEFLKMPVIIGEVEALCRYPVKSMSGELLHAADLGWHGLDGDRRLGFRRVNDRSGFPWLSASRLPELILFTPQRRDTALPGSLPSHVRTPEGVELPLFGGELAADVGRRHGSPVEMMYLDRGIFDEATISVITSTTAAETARLAALPADFRRFRPNIVVRSVRSVPYEEDEWVGGVLSFGEGDNSAAIAITNRDERCSMVNYHPDSGHPAPELLKAIVGVRGNKVGVYGTTIRRGQIAAGHPVYFESRLDSPAHS